MQREVEAAQYYRHALQLDADYARAQYNLAYTLLRQGRLEEGWRCLKARTFYEPLARHFACPRWRGEPLQGKSMIIGFEGGHGDMIQFCRYASVLKDKGAASITVVCAPALQRLFRSLAGVDEVRSWMNKYRCAAETSGRRGAMVAAAAADTTTRRSGMERQLAV